MIYEGFEDVGTWNMYRISRNSSSSSTKARVKQRGREAELDYDESCYHHHPDLPHSLYSVRSIHSIA